MQVAAISDTKSRGHAKRGRSHYERLEGVRDTLQPRKRWSLRSLARIALHSVLGGGRPDHRAEADEARIRQHGIAEGEACKGQGGGS